jgi:serine/threonine-protein kinase
MPVEPSPENDPFDGHYQLGELLGSGGMGNVYSAVQVSLGRRVAIKLPQAQLVANPVVTRRFRAEALAGSRIDHRNIARVMDFGERDGVQFLVMEYLAGVTLDRLLVEHGAMSSGVAASVCGQVLDGLGAAHTAGVIHADIKSGNVLVETRADGALIARVIDFGLAHFCNEPAFQRDRLLSGTPEYLAPEVIVGGVPSVASDVYAAGVILYELLTGATPFGGGTSDDILRRHTDEAVVPPSLRAPDQNIGRDIDAVVMCALAKHPTRRFASAASFAVALRACRIELHRVAKEIARPFEGKHIKQMRRSIAQSMSGGDGDVIVTSYLELARALIDERELPRAIAELEEGLEVLRLETRIAKPSGTWRLQLCLAALYSGVGQSDRARAAASLGNADAIHAASRLGQERANELLVRLARKIR